MPLVEARVDYALVQRSAMHRGRHGHTSPGRTTETGHPVAPPVPGSTIKGSVRRASEDLARAFGLPVCVGPSTCRLGVACSVCSLFGNPGLEAPLAWSDAAPHREIAPLLARAGLAEVRGRMAVDRLTGSGMEDSLAAMETTAGGMVYAGVVSGWLLPCGDDERLPQTLLLLLASLRSTIALGSGRSVGLGACAFEIESVALGALSLPGEQALAQLDRLGIAEGA